MTDAGNLFILLLHISRNQLHQHAIDVCAVTFGTIEVGTFEIRDFAGELHLWDSDQW